MFVGQVQSAHDTLTFGISLSRIVLKVEKRTSSICPRLDMLADYFTKPLQCVHCSTNYGTLSLPNYMLAMLEFD